MDGEKKQLYDVVIAECETRKVVSIIGKAMRREGAHNSAERRLETAYERINDRHFAEIVEAGRFKEGDVLPEEIES